MKKTLFIATLVFGFIANAQIVNIPDANFKAMLLSADASYMIASTETSFYNAENDYWMVSTYHSIDTNGDNEIQMSEAQAIKCLYLSNLDISNITGIESFINLQTLYITDNHVLNNLNVSQFANLQVLDCRNDALSSLNVSQNPNLHTLWCGSNGLTTLNVSQNPNLNTLMCYNNQLTTLNVSQNANLQKLGCSSNQLTSLDVSQNINLQSLNCSYNPLTSFDISQNVNLSQLICSDIELTSLDVTQNVNLESLYCQSNQLTSLNTSGCTNLQHLHCYNNQLTSLNVSQNVNLQSLYCYNNQLTSLNVSQNVNLLVLDCQYNLITSLIIKNSNTYWNYLGFYVNPNLQYICADEEDVAMVQQIINNYGYASTCQVNSYCSFTPGGTFYTINGNNRFDGNANGCDSGDFAYPNLKLNLTNGTQSGSLIANGLGNFIIPVSAGIHTITPQPENPSYFNISPPTVTVYFPTTASQFTQDFCITPNGVHNDVEVTLFPIGVARPGFDSSYKMVYKNKGNTIQSGTVLFNFDDCHQVTDFVSATPNPDVVSYNELAFNYTNLLPFETREITVTLNVNSPMETPAVNIGDFLSIIASITPIVDDENVTNNTSNLRQIVVGSYDPNDKTCLEGETINPSMIGEYVNYQIRFENTGTYPAQNVVVKDMIDTTKFDIATLQMVSTSHSCYTRITGNKVEFIFENINLPFDDATNDGYVVFKIKTLPTLTINSTISNTAEIYFDYNFPIVTNTATSTYQVLDNQDFDFANEFSLYPNPVKNVLNISAKNGLEIQSLEIYNTLGQLVIAKPNFEQTIDVSALKTGVYFIRVSTEKGSGSVKFIKE